MVKDRTCCFSGHRPEKMPFAANANSYAFQQFHNALTRTVYDAIHSGYNHFITGMSRGMDLWAAQEVIAYREAYPELVLEAAVPFLGQESLWSEQDQALYNAVREACDSVVILSPEHRPNVMHQRNRYMVDRSSLLIAAYDGTAGGTRYTVEYARSRGLQIINLFETDYFDYTIL